MVSSPIRVVVLGIRESSGEVGASSAPALVATSEFFLDSDGGPEGARGTRGARIRELTTFAESVRRSA